jgi:ABC-type multidrug transport system fused ATPase/permease subunit
VADSVDKKPAILEHEDSGLKYLLGKNTVLFENGVTMERKIFEEIKNAPGKVRAALAAELEAGTLNTGFDWPYACSTGSLRRKKANAELVASARTERKRRREAAAEAPQAGEEAEKKGPPQRHVLSSAFPIMVVMASVGVGSAVMSAYHTSAFLAYGGKPAWTAVLTGIMLILFSTTAFTAARHLFQEKGGLHYFFGTLFVIFGFAVIAYSMFSTLTVNFEQFRWRDSEKAQAAVSESSSLAAHRELVQRNGDALDEAAAEIALLESEAEYWRGRSWNRYDGIQKELIEARSRRNALREAGAELARRTPELAESEAVLKDTIYAFIARLFKADEDVMRFFVYAIPACLYDIFAPFALSTVLLLLDRRKEEEEK